MMAVCRDCKSYFRRADDEDWKLRCYACWKRSKASAAPPPASPIVPTEMLRRLIQLCHPDKHGNSETATIVTRWLLSLRPERH